LLEKVPLLFSLVLQVQLYQFARDIATRQMKIPVFGGSTATWIDHRFDYGETHRLDSTRLLAMFKSAFISRPRQMCGEADTGTCFAVEQPTIGLSPRRCPGHKGRVAGSGWPHVQGID
jgi:hypothetical protein